jgi:hypothetical protein
MLADVDARLAKIKFRARFDNERAHEFEDGLYKDVLRIAAQSTDEFVAALARKALEADEIDYARWHS